MRFTELISAHELNSHLLSTGLTIVDCRFSTKDPAQGFRDYRAGHIPRAMSLPRQGNLAEDGLFKDAAQLGMRFKEVVKDIPPDHVIHYCGSGVTATHNALACAIAGLYGARVYIGSFSEWITDSSRPVEVGDGEELSNKARHS